MQDAESQEHALKSAKAETEQLQKASEVSVHGITCLARLSSSK